MIMLFDVDETMIMLMTMLLMTILLMTMLLMIINVDDHFVDYNEVDDTIMMLLLIMKLITML